MSVVLAFVAVLRDHLSRFDTKAATVQFNPVWVEIHFIVNDGMKPFLNLAR